MNKLSNVQKLAAALLRTKLSLAVDWSTVTPRQLSTQIKPGGEIEDTAKTIAKKYFTPEELDANIPPTGLSTGPGNRMGAMSRELINNIMSPHKITNKNILQVAGNPAFGDKPNRINPLDYIIPDVSDTVTSVPTK